MVADLAPAEVHLVLTGREPLGLFTASWQESIKNRDTTPMADYARTESSRQHRGVELAHARHPPGARAVVPGLPAPSGCTSCRCPATDAPRREIWDRFAGLIGVDPDSVDLTQSFPNASMGVVEAETLRRINHHLGDFDSAIDRGTYIRTFLADERLVPREGDPFWPDEERIEEIRERGRAAVDYIAAQGFHVIGDLDSLLVPDELPPRRVPESVTDGEVAEVAVELAATAAPRRTRPPAPAPGPARGARRGGRREPEAAGHRSARRSRAALPVAAAGVAAQGRPTSGREVGHGGPRGSR